MSLNSNEFDDLSEICEYFNYWCFFSSGAPYFGPTNTNHTKNDQKNTVGALFRKTAQNALQCTTVHCNVAPQLLTTNGSNMTHNDPR